MIHKGSRRIGRGDLKWMSISSCSSSGRASIVPRSGSEGCADSFAIAAERGKVARLHTIARFARRLDRRTSSTTIANVHIGLTITFAVLANQEAFARPDLARVFRIACSILVRVGCADIDRRCQDIHHICEGSDADVFTDVGAEDGHRGQGCDYGSQGWPVQCLPGMLIQGHPLIPRRMS